MAAEVRVDVEPSAGRNHVEPTAEIVRVGDQALDARERLEEPHERCRVQFVEDGAGVARPGTVVAHRALARMRMFLDLGLTGIHFSLSGDRDPAQRVLVERPADDRMGKRLGDAIRGGQVAGVSVETVEVDRTRHARTKPS